MAKSLWDQDWSAPQGDAPVASNSSDMWSRDWSIDAVEPSVADPEMGDTVAGANSGLEGLKGLWQYGKAGFGQMIKNPEMLKEGLAAAKEHERKAAEYGQGRITNWDDITDFDKDPIQFAKDFADYAQFGMGTLAPHAAESALSAIAGGVIGAATTGGVATVPGFFGGLLTKQAMKETLKAYAKHELKDIGKDKLEAQVKKDFAEYAAGTLKDEAKKQVIQGSIKRAGASIGAKAGAFGAGTSTGFGDLYSNTVVDGEGSPYMAAAGAPIYGALDLIPEAMGIDRIMKSGAGSRLGNFVKGLFTQAPVGSVTEMSQEEMNIQLQALHDPNYDPWGEDAWVRRRESGILGFMGDGVLGGATGALQKPVSEAQSVDEAIALADQHAGMVLHGARQQQANQRSAIQSIVGASDVSLQTMPTSQEDAYRKVVESIFNDAKQNLPISQEERNQNVIDQTPTELTEGELAPARQLAADADIRQRLAINEKEPPEAAQARQEAQASWIDDLQAESSVDKAPINKAMADALAKAGVVTEQQAADAGVKFSSEQLAERANQAATSDLNDLNPPTEAQKEAGNYKVGKITLNGLGVSIENPKGSLREGTDKDGVKWSQKLGAHYGYIRGTVGADKDHVDTFLTDNASDANAPVFVVDQVTPGTTKFDEHKVILGALSEQEAVDTYLSNYEAGWKGLGSITQMDQATFKEWVKDPKNTARRLSLRKYKGTPSEAGTVESERPVPKGRVSESSRAAFEVAPNPTNVELKGKWDGLSDEQRLAGSRKVADEIVPKVLKRLGIKGGITDQVGGYQDDTNPSFALNFEGEVTEAQVEEVTRLLGYVLSQESMMTTSEVELPGSEEVGAVSIKLPKGLSVDEVRKIYNNLRKLRVRGKQVIEGHSTRDGVMDILNYSDVPTKELVGLVRNKLLGKYPVTSKTLYSIFPDDKTYGFDNDVEANALRDEATAKVQALFDGEAVAFSPRSVALKDEIPGFKALYPYLTKAERENLSRKSAATLVEIFESMPNPAEVASVAYAGRAKRGWYKNSARALVEVFGAVDAPRFAGLLAAMSPQTSVENNAINALNTWANWIAEGRPTEREAIIQVMGRSVQGNKGVDSILDAWINNSVRALTATDPTEIMLSGPKVNSFMLNLRDEVNEVTNDAWMANYSGVDQILFSGSATKSGPGKRPGYLAMSATVRNAAKIVSKRTGEKWTPAEVQETVWSWAKALYELRDSRTNNATIAEILAAGDLTHDMINDTPDFELVFIGGVYRNILEGAGYGKEVAEVERVVKSRLADNQGDGRRAHVTDAEGAGVAQDTFERHLGRAGERLEKLRTVRRGGVSLSTRQEVLSDGKPVTSGGRATEAAKTLGRRLGLGEDAYVEVGVRDATTRTFVDTFVEKILGKRVVFFKNVSEENPKFNGVVLRETADTIYLDADGDRAHLVTLGHELLHAMKLDFPTLYEDLRSALMPLLNDYAPYKKFINKPRSKLGMGDLSEEAVIEELIGDLMGDGFADPQFWAKVNQKSPALLVKVATAIKTFLDSVLEVLVGKQLQGTKYYSDYKKARDFAALAMAEYADKRVKSLDLIKVTEDLVVEETGERITLETPASVMLEQSDNRVNALRQLQRCLSL